MRLHIGCLYQSCQPKNNMGLRTIVDGRSIVNVWRQQEARREIECDDCGFLVPSGDRYFWVEVKEGGPSYFKIRLCLECFIERVRMARVDYVSDWSA